MKIHLDKAVFTGYNERRKIENTKHLRGKAMSNNTENFKKTKYACYYTYLATASIFCLPPMLFVTFKEMYSIPYTLLGTLVSVNFCTQLAIDLIFSFFAEFFNIKKIIKVLPLMTTAGLLTYAITPNLFPQHAFIGLLVGTVIFSLASGLNEVLLSPIVASLPSETPDRDMSMLHSLYAWGVLFVVGTSTVFLKIFGTENWMYLTFFWALLPIFSSVLFCTSPLPDLNLSGSGTKHSGKSDKFGLVLCVLCIFFGGAAENTMTNWISAYLENSLNIPKAVGDIVGLALFAILLGFGRTVYAKYGKNITTVLLICMVCSTVCYLIAGLSPIPAISLIACTLTGICTSMLWPGSLIMMEEKLPNVGVAAYALMAAGGDLGGSIAPQIMGAIVDTVQNSHFGEMSAEKFAITAEQAGMKAGMLSTAIFPLAGTFLLVYIKRHFGKRERLK